MDDSRTTRRTPAERAALIMISAWVTPGLA